MSKALFVQISPNTPPMLYNSFFTLCSRSPLKTIEFWWPHFFTKLPLIQAIFHKTLLKIWSKRSKQHSFPVRSQMTVIVTSKIVKYSWNDFHIISFKIETENPTCKITISSLKKWIHWPLGHRRFGFSTAQLYRLCCVLVSSCVTLCSFASPTYSLWGAEWIDKDMLTRVKYLLSNKTPPNPVVPAKA